MLTQDASTILKKKLEHAREWMQREISGPHIQETIAENLSAIFAEEMQRFLPENTFENITSAELVYHHMLSGEQLDGIGVIIGYQKVFDAMVESYITQGYRDYMQDKKISSSNIHDPLEQALSHTCKKHYILSAGRIYGLLKNIREEAIAGSIYQKYFEKYLEDNNDLQKALLKTDFFIQLESLIESQVLGEKRHIGQVSLEQTQLLRRLFVDDFASQNGLLSILLSSQKNELK